MGNGPKLVGQGAKPRASGLDFKKCQTTVISKIPLPLQRIDSERSMQTSSIEGSLGDTPVSTV